MKTRRILHAITFYFVAIVTVGTASAQMSEYKFKQQFDIAFELTLNGEHEAAQTILKQLHNSDEEHAQVTYLLALNTIKSGNLGQQTLSYLERIVQKVSIYHQTGRVEDRTVPVRAWFYLAKSYDNLNKYDKAISAYRNYMSYIQLAPINHKREIAQLINSLRLRKADSNAYFREHELAGLKP